jgi:hypothetical protein
MNGGNNMSAKVLQWIATASLMMLSGCDGASAAPPDPVRVVDERSGRVMTERDVIALSNIHHFAVTESDPHHHDLSRHQIENLVSLLNRRMAETGRMPQFFSEAAAYWIDLQRGWSKLSAKQQRHTREYAASMLRMGASSQEGARKAQTTTRTPQRSPASRHSGHDHESCGCEHRSSHNHRHVHGHGHASNGSGHKQQRGSGQSSRHNPASVTAEITNAPLALDAIFP